MSVQLEVEEVAEGDYSPEYGTVKTAVDGGDVVSLTFVSGTEISLSKGTELEIEQGGRFDHGPTRPSSGEDLGGAGPL